ncbi:type II toxin-antitoxin system Phd/YefM family antitoxin [Saccharospirillum salsuginis]|uniref:Antitoxin n=1 Tax=Saccharospirillum salsuginis TaxID=418750 RepID=A0A918K5J8_9GAMM|nr:type II toxin-antitoxin system Phd/YefM family antitoxin [Saccharospirillum salsuginis]GGX46305.1 antitoxin [Saccharospirillum salsuginis]
MKIEQVTNLKRQATKILDELHRDKEAILITEHGQPSAYLVDVDDYELLQRRLKLLDGLAKGERDILSGNTHSQAEAKEKLKKWLS